MPDSERIGGGFTEGELEVAGFWVRNHLLIRKIARGTLIAANVLVWGYALWGILDAYAISYPRESRIIAHIAQNQFIASELASNRPQSIQTGPVNVFQSTDKRLDFLVPLINANEQWWVDFTYQFNVSGELTPMRSGFLLPGEKSYVGEFGFAPKTQGARSGVLVVDNIRWHRLDPTQVGDDFGAWLERRKQFRVEDVQFAPVGGTGNAAGSRSHFTFINPSAYGFWNVKLYIVLKRGTATVGATTLTLDRVLSGERRSVDADWFETLPSVTDTEIVPVVNYLDDSVYLPSGEL